MTSEVRPPGDEHLRSLGELTYAVSLLEWSVLGDLAALGDELPASVDVSVLDAMSTDAIAFNCRPH